jgi:GT2 family glycosyltransferase
MTFTVMISTRDRRPDLEVTCEKLMELRPAPDEVIICADGCNDGTAEMLRLRFPQFKTLENPLPKGDMYSRDRILRMARGEIVLSLDDDSYPIQRDFFEKLPLILSKHPEAAVVVFPELRNGNLFSTSDKSDTCPGHYVSAYANCAAAMRRDFYLGQPGFPVFFTHMYEEPDYALQSYAAGAAVWFEPSLTVRHHLSTANRRPVARHHFNARNELWSVWLRCPWPALPIVSAYRLLRQFAYAASEGMDWALREPVWWLAALRGRAQCRTFREPVHWLVYYRWMRLARSPIYRVQDLREKFPPGSLGPKQPRAPG